MTIDGRLELSGSTDPRTGTTAVAWASALGRSIPTDERREEGNA
ncbi:hypothetical protein [Halorubrum salsamenti]|nr:hypothetical protein [Halorubrum salsamenti]